MVQDARLALATTFGRVTLGKNVQIIGPCVLGLPGRGVEPDEAELHIPDGSIIRPFTTIYAGAILGDGFQTGQGSVIREHNVFGEDVCVGSNSVIEGGCTFGSHIRVQGCVSMGEATIEDWVFIGNVVAITDDPHPMKCPHYPCTGGAHIKKYARIGGGVTLLPGVVVGENAFVAAGSLVTKDIPDGMLAMGVPAKVVKPVSEMDCQFAYYEHPFMWPPYEKQV